MLNRELVISARHGTLQEAPDVLNPIGVNISTNVFFGTMIDDLMFRVVVSDPSVGLFTNVFTIEPRTFGAQLTKRF